MKTPRITGVHSSGFYSPTKDASCRSSRWYEELSYASRSRTVQSSRIIHMIKFVTVFAEGEAL